MIPTLLELAQDRDPRIRALAVRALRKHVADDAVFERVVACAEDGCWQVRRGAYATVADAPIERAAPVLEAALAREEGDQARVLKQHLNDFGRGDAPGDAKFKAFGLPLTSRRGRFVVELSDKMEPKSELVVAEFARAIDTLPDGAFFEIIVAGSDKPVFAKKPMKVSAHSCARAEKWLKKLKKHRPTTTSRLFGFLTPDYDDPLKGKCLFPELPDALYLICHDLDEKQAIRGVARFLIWNDSCDAALYVRFMGKAEPEELRDLTKKTGGAYLAGN